MKSNPPNLLRDLRLRLGLTQKDLAARAHITRSAVIRSEQLIPHVPPVGLVAALCDASMSAGHFYSEPELSHVYVINREEMIKDNFASLKAAEGYQALVAHAINHAIDFYGPKAPPVKLFRIYLFDHYGLPLSAIKFCQFTGLHPATLSEIETGKVDWPSTGLAFKEVLRELGLSEAQLAILGRAHDNYFLSI